MTKLYIIADSGYKYFGTYIFFIMEAFACIDFDADFVAPEKKL